MPKGIKQRNCEIPQNLQRHTRAETEENPKEDSRYPGRDTKYVSRPYNTRELTLYKRIQCKAQSIFIYSLNGARALFT